MAKLYLLFGVHNHQPVGNFDKVFEKAYALCYLPFLKTLYNFPRLHCNVHFSGCLFDWLEEHRKSEIFGLLQEMSARGQIEILSGGYYEPILSLIPAHDRLGQIRYMNEFLQKRFSSSPRGMWLTERVWEQGLAKDIKEAGLDYTLVDDAHLRYAGILKDNFFGYYRTEEEGRFLNIFPISKLLRYRIPFSTLEELRALLFSLKDSRQDRLITIMDDGEKFGLWPHTYKWVYEQGWLEGFFRLLEENSGWVETLTFSRSLEMFPSQGLVYLPAASYAEMMEWVLEPDAFRAFTALKEKAKGWEGGEVFLRGGYFRNFLRKYPEINHMHKRMFLISRRLRQDASFDGEALRALWKAQCNCAWWHGVFGGFYLGHLRDAVYQNLLAAEKRGEEKRGLELEGEEIDFDGDGHNEVFLRNRHINIIAAPARGGAIEEIDAKKFLLNLSNCLSRRPENYHASVGRKKPLALGREPQSIHNLVKAKEEGLEKVLVYDRYRKVSFIEGFVPKEGGLGFLKSRGLEDSFSGEEFRYVLRRGESELRLEMEGGRGDVKINKDISLAAGRSGAVFSYRFVCGNEELMRRKFLGIEFNLFIPSLDSAYYTLGGRNLPLFQDSYLPQCESLDIIDKFRRFKLEFRLPAAAAAVFPVFSVSSSEGGFEKNLQHMCVVFMLDMSFAREFKLVFNVADFEEEG